MKRALDKLKELEKLDSKIFTDDKNFELTLEEVVFIGRLVETHYYQNNERIYDSYHFKADGYEYLEVIKAKEFNGNVTEQYVYEKID